MRGMTAVFLVASGQYDDYRIDAVCATRQAAEAWIAGPGLDERLEIYGPDFPWSDNDRFRIEERPLIEEQPTTP